MTKRERQRLHDQRRGTRTARGYDNRWLRARAIYLRRNPDCIYCDQVGRVTQATVVDHRIPHQGDQALFWDEANWQALCARCHSSLKQSEEKGAGRIGCDQAGNPTDPRHHWLSK